MFDSGIWFLLADSSKYRDVPTHANYLLQHSLPSSFNGLWADRTCFGSKLFFHCFERREEKRREEKRREEKRREEKRLQVTWNLLASSEVPQRIFSMSRTQSQPYHLECSFYANSFLRAYFVRTLIIRLVKRLMCDA